MKKQIILVGVIIAVAVASIISYTLFKTPETANTAINAPAAVEDTSEELPTGNGTVYTIDPTHSEARFIIEEVLRNEDTTVVGTTNQVSGQVTLDRSDVQNGRYQRNPHQRPYPCY